MTQASNETGDPPTPLRIGLITTGERTALFAGALATTPGCTLVAQAGPPRGAALPDVEWFSDHRVAIAQAGLDAVVLDLSPRDAAATGRIAAEHGLGVWRTPPLGRTFAESAEAVLHAQSRGKPYRVASWYEYTGDVLRGAMAAPERLKPTATEIDVSAAGPPLDSWRSSEIDAGGGVLMLDAYAPLEALLALRGLPITVHAATARARRRPDQPPRETEDFAAAILRYDNGVALVRARWDIPPYQSITLHHGRGRSVRFSDLETAVLDAQGAIVEDHSLPNRWLEWEMSRLIAELRGEVPAHDTQAVIERHMAMAALMESMYLSNRTGQLENPRKFYEVQGWPEPSC